MNAFYVAVHLLLKNIFSVAPERFWDFNEPCPEELNFCTYMLKVNCPRHTFSCTNCLS